jgi:hypothetical protein
MIKKFQNSHDLSTQFTTYLTLRSISSVIFLFRYPVLETCWQPIGRLAHREGGNGHGSSRLYEGIPLYMRVFRDSIAAYLICFLLGGRPKLLCVGLRYLLYVPRRAITSVSREGSGRERSLVRGLMNILLILVPQNRVSRRHLQTEAFLGMFMHGFVRLRRIGGPKKGNSVSGRHLMGALLGVCVHDFTLWRRIGGANRRNVVIGRHLMGASLVVGVHGFVWLKRIGGLNKRNGVSGRHLMETLLCACVHGFMLWRVASANRRSGWHELS